MVRAANLIGRSARRVRSRLRRDLIGQSGPPIEIDWHWSDRYLGGGRHITAVDERSRRIRRPHFLALLRAPTCSGMEADHHRAVLRLAVPEPPEPAAAPEAVVSLVALCVGCGPRGPSFAATSPVRCSNVHGRLRPDGGVHSIAPELRVPVGVRAIAVDGVPPALALDPFAIAARIAPDMVQIEVADDGQELAIASRPAAVVLPLQPRRTPDGWPRTCPT